MLQHMHEDLNKIKVSVHISVKIYAHHILELGGDSWWTPSRWIVRYHRGLKSCSHPGPFSLWNSNVMTQRSERCFFLETALKSFTLVLQAAGARVTFSVSQTRWPPPSIEACRPGLLCISSLPQYRGRSSDHRPQCQCQRNANMNTSEPTLSVLFSGHHHPYSYGTENWIILSSN